MAVIHSFREKCDKNIDTIQYDSKILTKSGNRKLACERSEFGKHGKGSLDEVIHQISSGCDMQFQ